jgi:Flp pilus assembly pilin Flp
MTQLLARLHASLFFPEEGQAIVEYAFILALVSVAGIAFLASIGKFPSAVFSQINADF